MSFLKIPKNIDLTLNIILYMAHQNNKNTYCAKSSLEFEKKKRKKKRKTITMLKAIIQWLNISLMVKMKGLLNASTTFVVENSKCRASRISS